MNPSDLTSIPARRHYQCLDAWRGIACLMVVAFHSSNDGYATAAAPGSGTGFAGIGGSLLKIVSLMWVGVPIFFVISGYCIASASDSAREHRRGLGAFIFRRFRRIHPTYWAALAFAIALIWGVSFVGWPELFHDGIHPIPRLSSLTWGNWAGNVALIETWRAPLFGGDYRFVAAQTWTLCYEERFYLICGLLVAIVPCRFFLGVGAVSVLVATRVILTWLIPSYPNISGVFFDGRWFLFAVGVSVYYRIHHATGAAPRLLPPSLAAIALGGFAGRSALFASLGSQLVIEMIVGGLCGAALILLWGSDVRLASLRALRPLSWCGTRSYSIDLVHWTACKAVSRTLWMAGFRDVWSTLLVSIPVALGTSFLLGWGLFTLVERRFCNRPHKGPSTSPDSPPSAPRRSVPTISLVGVAS
ncbi:acyltransferase [Isosphaeraceae bacterium EP7]